jgi:hypothetical protein
MCAISGYIQVWCGRFIENIIREKRFDCSKSRYIQRSIFSMHVRFSIHVFSNLELLQKRSISHTPKTKNNYLHRRLKFERTKLKSDCHKLPPCSTGLSQPCRQHVTCVGKKEGLRIRMDPKNRKKLNSNIPWPTNWVNPCSATTPGLQRTSDMEKSLCPIHSGGFLSAMLTWFNLIIRPEKRKDYYYTHAQLSTVLHI